MDVNSGKYEVVIIEEGLGNLNDLSYYTRQAIEAAANDKIFEGAQAYADHPSKDEEVLRPERSVRDLIGFYSDTKVATNPDTGGAMLVATLSTNPGVSYDWSRSLLETSIDNSGRFDQQLIGISINAGGGYVKKSIDEVLADDTLPVSVKPKILKAKSEGATEVDWCVELSDVVSADLVTRAGARGRALKRLIESERNRMPPKKVKENEAKMKEKKEAKMKEDASAPADNDGDHADADQDKELIASMLKKYVGGDDHSEEAHEAMHEMHEAAKEMGLEGEAAQDCAGYSMKMAKHAAEKKEAEAKEAADAAPGDEDDQGEDEGDGADDSQSPPPAAGKMPPKKMESEIMRLSGLVSGLSKKVRENEVNEFLNKTIRESGFEGKIAKKFKEAIGSVSSEKEISSKAKIFKEALALAQGGPIYINPEKTNFNSETSVSFADCVKE